MSKHACIYENCTFNRIVDTDKDAYSFKKIGGKKVYWHYLCYQWDSKRLLSLPENSIKQLRNLVYDHFPDGDEKLQILVALES